MVSMSQKEFVDAVFVIAKQKGYIQETGRNGIRQIDFGNKKLHEDHLRQLYPKILHPLAITDTSYTRKLIEDIAPGRPCTHKPMREIVESLLHKLKNGEAVIPAKAGIQRI